jgi:hypothetical protein
MPQRTGDGIDIQTTQQRRDFLAINAEGRRMGSLPREQAVKTFFHPDGVVGPNVAARFAARSRPAIWG